MGGALTLAAGMIGCGNKAGPSADSAPPLPQPRPPLQATWQFRPLTLRGQRLIRFAAAQPAPGGAPMPDGPEEWMFEWDLKSAAEGQTLQTRRTFRGGYAPNQSWRLVGEDRLVSFEPGRTPSMKIGQLHPDGSAGCDWAGHPGLEPLPFYKVEGPVFSRSGACFLAAGPNGGIYRTAPSPTRLGPLPQSKRWKEFLEPQPCELDAPNARLYLSEDGQQVVRVPYIWRWDESGFADEYPMLLIYDTARDTIAEHILRVGEKTKVADLAFIDGQIWLHLIVHRPGSRIEQVITDLKRTASYPVKPAQKPEEPLLWDAEGQKLVRVGAIEGAKLPEKTILEIHDYRTGTVVKGALAYGPR